jgi:ATP-dependent DNA ligase
VVLTGGAQKEPRPVCEIQAAMNEGKTDQLAYFAFDLLFLNGERQLKCP